MRANSVNIQQSVNAMDLEQAVQTTTMLHEADIGIGVYDQQLRLLSSNPMYREMRGMSDELSVIGTPFQKIMAAMIISEGLDANATEELIKNDLERLRRNGQDRLNVRSAQGDGIRLTRCVKPSGIIVETADRRDWDDGAAFDGYRGHNETQAQSRRRLLMAMDNMADGFAVFSANGTLVALNERFRELCPDIRTKLVVGVTYVEIFRAAYIAGLIDPNEVTEEEFIASKMRQWAEPEEPTVVRQNDGQWVRMAGKKQDDGSVIFIRSDVTELTRQRLKNEEIGQALTLKTKQLHHAIDNMTAGLIMFDKDHKMIFGNNQYIELFGFPKDFVKPGITRMELLAKAHEMGLFEDDSLGESTQVFQESVGSQTNSINRYFLRDGRILQVRYAPILDVGCLLLIHDITNEQKAEEQLMVNNKMLERSNAELQNFAYVASHDLQEPLRKIEAFGDRLTRKYNDVLPEDGRLYLDRIQNASGRMRQLINDLLSFSRVTSNAEEFKPTDLNIILDGVVDDIQVQLEETGGAVRAIDLPTIDADPSQMRQLFQNLISNSLKFARDGTSPIIKVSASKVFYFDHHGREVSRVEIMFEDNGIGFDNRFKDQIFAIFQRLHGRAEYEGTGIGLATCRKIIDHHSGHIDASGEDGVGATFTIELPIENLGRE